MPIYFIFFASGAAAIGGGGGGGVSGGAGCCSVLPLLPRVRRRKLLTNDASASTCSKYTECDVHSREYSSSIHSMTLDRHWHLTKLNSHKYIDKYTYTNIYVSFLDRCACWLSPVSHITLSSSTFIVNPQTVRYAFRILWANPFLLFFVWFARCTRQLHFTWFLVRSKLIEFFFSSFRCVPFLYSTVSFVWHFIDSTFHTSTHTASERSCPTDIFCYNGIIYAMWRRCRIRIYFSFFALANSKWWSQHHRERNVRQTPPPLESYVCWSIER